MCCNSVLVEIMVWNRLNNNPLSAPVMTLCRMRLCITSVYSVNDASKHFILISNLFLCERLHHHKTREILKLCYTG